LYPRWHQAQHLKLKRKTMCGGKASTEEAKVLKVKELPPPKCTLGDTINHKRHLDESFCKVRACLVCVEKFGTCAGGFAHHFLAATIVCAFFTYPLPPPLPMLAQTFEDVCHDGGMEVHEDLAWGNTKMYIMASASTSALVAQFYPLPFPDNIWLLGVCVAIYFFLSGVLQYMVTFLDKDVIYSSAPVVLDGKPAVARLHSSLPKGSQSYTLKVEFGSSLVVERVYSVGRFYRTDGFLVPNNVRQELEALLLPFLKQQKQSAAGGGAASPAAAAPHSSSKASSNSSKASGAASSAGEATNNPVLSSGPKNKKQN